MRCCSLLLLAALALLCAASLVAARRPSRPVRADPVGPDVYCLTFETNIANGTGAPIVIEVTRAWAPLGADRVYALVNDRFFDQLPSAFFRVVPRFVVQFGIAGVPSLNDKWNVVIPDDPVRQSNLNGTLTFATAGPDTRTTQLFINTADNAGLDRQGFAPLGRVLSGMGSVIAIFNPTPGSSDGVDQDAYAAKGYNWIEQQYPGINSITKAMLVDKACAKGF